MSRSRAGQKRHRRRLVALAAAVLVMAVGTASAIGSVRGFGFILDQGFIGLPPEGAAPSTPERGELVLERWGRSEIHARPHWRGGLDRPLVHVWVYADGRMIWSRSGSTPAGANDLVSGYLEQRLTPDGVELLRSELAATFERFRGVLETVPPDYDPLHGLNRGSLLVVPADYAWGMVVARNGDRLVRLRWNGVERGSARFHEYLDDLRKRFDVSIATSQQVSALRRIDALATDPESVLPASAWATRKVRAYVPSHYQVCMDTSPPKDLSHLLALLPAPAANVLRGKSLKGSESDLIEAREGGRTVVVGRSVTYCSKLTTEEAREVAEPFSGRDEDPRFGGGIIGYRLAEPVAKGFDPTSLWFEPYFPHGQVTCSSCG
jgi:hypothetical protein